MYLNFNADNCKNCYKCLRDCPVKAITVIDERARIDERLCILCGHCVNACRFNAKEVESAIPTVKKLLKGKVIATVAPAFTASFDVNFAQMRAALAKLGFFDAEETAVGAAAVTAEYDKLLETGQYRNLIASACPSIVRLIQIYYPEALPYLAQVDSPMVAHAKILKSEFPDAKIVFIGPCIAKKRESDESGVISAALTFEELETMLQEAGITFGEESDEGAEANRARYYPINRGIIKSFYHYNPKYEYVSVDGVSRAKEVLANIGTLNGMFIEMHACEFSCINGPCALNKDKGGFIKATERVRAYSKTGAHELKIDEGIDIRADYKKLPDIRVMPPEHEIRRILEATSKYKPEDELNCGACGYPTCRDKAIAVYNHMATLDMCVPYMRERAESMSFDIIRSSPNGIVAVDGDFRITEINDEAKRILGIHANAKGELLEDFFNPTEFYIALLENRTVERKRMQIEKTGKWVEMTVKPIADQNTAFGILTDITDEIHASERMNKLRADTLSTTDKVIENQMRVVQEIASLLGETAAETKVALIKLKNAVAEDEKEEKPAE